MEHCDHSCDHSDTHTIHCYIKAGSVLVLITIQANSTTTLCITEYIFICCWYTPVIDIPYTCCCIRGASLQVAALTHIITDMSIIFCPGRQPTDHTASQTCMTDPYNHTTVGTDW